MSEFGGKYPGGPSRREEGEERPGRPHLEGVGDFEARTARAHSRETARRRSRRVGLGFLFAILLSGGIGLAVGYMSHTPPEQHAQERDAAGRGSTDASAEVNRVLMELWRMEDVEAQRNQGGR